MNEWMSNLNSKKKKQQKTLLKSQYKNEEKCDFQTMLHEVTQL